MMRALVAFVLCCVPLVSYAAPSIVLFNGNVFTGDPARPSAEAVAIEGNRIVAVGSNDEVRALADKDTRVIDVQGRLVIPGINDAHTHPGWAAESFGVASGIRVTLADLRAGIAAAVDETHADVWISAQGLDAPVINHPSLTNELLDKLAPGRKVMLSSHGSHSAILSSAAMTAFGIVPDAEDPPGGWYGRDAAGKVNGHAYEYAAWKIYRQFTDRASLYDIAESLRTFSRNALRYGITSVQAMSFVSETHFEEALAQAAIPLRVRHISFPADARARVTRTKGRAVKWILDGSPVERTAALRTAAYADGTRGRENFRDIAPLLKAAIDNDLQMLVHVIGDKTTETALNAIAKTKLVRPRLEHAWGLQRDLYPLARKTGAIAVLNPWHVTFSKYVPKGEYFPAASLLEAGIPIAIGSDGPLNPYFQIYHATVRTDNPAETLSREQALRAYTKGSAYAELMEKQKGTIARGMLADLAVLSQDILRVDAKVLTATRSVLTIIDGKIVHED